MEKTITLLDKLRDQIDRVDDEILYLLKRRVQTVKKVLKYKVDNDMEIYQPDREFYVIAKRCSKAKLMNLDEEFINKLYNLILEESNRIQEKHKEEAKVKSRIR